MLDIYVDRQEDVHSTLRVPKARPRELLSQERRRSRATSVSASFHKLPISLFRTSLQLSVLDRVWTAKENSVVHISCMPETPASIKVLASRKWGDRDRLDAECEGKRKADFTAVRNTMDNTGPNFWFERDMRNWEIGKSTRVMAPHLSLRVMN